MALATTCPDTTPDLIPGLIYPPEWHRQQEDEEQAWLDDYIRTLRFITCC